MKLFWCLSVASRTLKEKANLSAAATAAASSREILNFDESFWCNQIVFGATFICGWLIFAARAEQRVVFVLSAFFNYWACPARSNPEDNLLIAEVAINLLCPCLLKVLQLFFTGRTGVQRRVKKIERTFSSCRLAREVWSTSFAWLFAIFNISHAIPHAHYFHGYWIDRNVVVKVVSFAANTIIVQSYSVLVYK